MTDGSLTLADDRTFGGDLLFVDPIPSTSWFTNIRSAVARKDWDRLRRHVYARAGGRCETCRAVPRALHAHERFEYDFRARVQRVRRLVALCPACHEVTHFGKAALDGREGLAMAHLMRVRDWTEQEAVAHVDEAMMLWEVRSNYAWTVDLAVVAAAGIEVGVPKGTAS